MSNQFSQVLVSGVGLVDYFDIRSTGQVGPTSPVTVARRRGRRHRLCVAPVEREVGERRGHVVNGRRRASVIPVPHWRVELVTEDRFKRYASYGYSFSTFSLRTWGMMVFRDWNF